VTRQGYVPSASAVGDLLQSVRSTTEGAPRDERPRETRHSGSCRRLLRSANIDQEGLGSVAGLNFGSNMGQECRRVQLAAQSYTNSTTADQRATFRFYDAICSIHYGGTDHELITADRALFNDGGSSKKRGMDCLKSDSASVPTAKKNNFSAQVSID
jgi:hypothetical protein